MARFQIYSFFRDITRLLALCLRGNQFRANCSMEFAMKILVDWINIAMKYSKTELLIMLKWRLKIIVLKFYQFQFIPIKNCIGKICNPIACIDIGTIITHFNFHG